jgi:hypothetical protein
MGFPGELQRFRSELDVSAAGSETLNFKLCQATFRCLQICANRGCFDLSSITLLNVWE